MGMLNSQDKPSEEGMDDADNPAYEAAFQMAMDALYGKEAAHDVAKAIRLAKDPTEALSNTAYEMVQIVDEKTQGQVPPELLVALASNILGEVADIAKAAGVQVTGAMIAEATREMLIRYVTEQGMDPSQLQQAMGQIDTSKLGALIDKAEA